VTFTVSASSDLWLGDCITKE